MAWEHGQLSLPLNVGKSCQKKFRSKNAKFGAENLCGGGHLGAGVKS